MLKAVRNAASLHGYPRLTGKRQGSSLALEPYRLTEASANLCRNALEQLGEIGVAPFVHEQHVAVLQLGF